MLHLLHTLPSNPESAVTFTDIFLSLMTLLFLADMLWLFRHVIFKPDPTYTRQQYNGLSEDNKAKWKSTHDPVE